MLGSLTKFCNVSFFTGSLVVFSTVVLFTGVFCLPILIVVETLSVFMSVAPFDASIDSSDTAVSPLALSFALKVAFKIASFEVVGPFLSVTNFPFASL